MAWGRRGLGEKGRHSLESDSALKRLRFHTPSVVFESASRRARSARAVLLPSGAFYFCAGGVVCFFPSGGSSISDSVAAPTLEALPQLARLLPFYLFFFVLACSVSLFLCAHFARESSPGSALERGDEEGRPREPPFQPLPFQPPPLPLPFIPFSSPLLSSIAGLAGLALMEPSPIASCCTFHKTCHPGLESNPSPLPWRTPFAVYSRFLRLQSAGLRCSVITFFLLAFCFVSFLRIYVSFCLIYLWLPRFPWCSASVPRLAFSEISEGFCLARFLLATFLGHFPFLRAISRELYLSFPYFVILILPAPGDWSGRAALWVAKTFMAFI